MTIPIKLALGVAGGAAGLLAIAEAPAAGPTFTVSTGMEAAIIGFLSAAAGALGMYAHGRRKAQNGHGRRNGEPSSSTTARLQVWDTEWREEVRNELKDFRRELFEPEGIVRRTDDKSRDAAQVAIATLAAATGRQYVELRDDVGKLSENVTELSHAVMKHGGHCSHCPGGS